MLQPILKTNANTNDMAAANAAPQPPEQLKRAFDLCVRKTRGNIKRLADEPKSAAWAVDGDYFKFEEGFYEIGNWTSSFFTGMALIAWRETEDEYFLNQVLRLAPHYREKVFTRHLDTHHDLGFLSSLYSVALYKLTGDRQHREVGLRAAEVLYERFNHAGNFIRAWGRMDTAEHDNMAIIDCMMNLPLLYWASLESGERKYHDVAVRSADTTWKYFLRADDSVLHAYRFDTKTGRPIGGDNYCGWSVDSHWARGTAWAIYGFALSFKYTRNARYLEAASRLALKFMSLLDGGVVPVWDFKLPAGSPVVRDASALAIAVCGTMELARLGGQDSKFFHSTRPMLLRLCAEDYLNSDENCRGVLKNAYGNQNGYSSWGDYFLMEALDRELHQGEIFW
jgi:unsaturated chondroitin disaccharide hydrolase